MEDTLVCQAPSSMEEKFIFKFILFTFPKPMLVNFVGTSGFCKQIIFSVAAKLLSMAEICKYSCLLCADILWKKTAKFVTLMNYKVTCLIEHKKLLLYIKYAKKTENFNIKIFHYILILIY
ncbi:hypothetical protein Anas_11275 [Armadillidium nasatum]|uniref:Uncharacterized protein n=1 Tax=Armadillidium nasatum TaxID=96803 RepID=A0A5N5TAP0_9CRUS|nr:hypothetical protein Anas_11275 [Armadillidium nasatum]